MARITIEDSLKQIPNRFELTLIATYRAGEISRQVVESLPRISVLDHPDDPLVAQFCGWLQGQSNTGA